MRDHQLPSHSSKDFLYHFFKNFINSFVHLTFLQHKHKHDHKARISHMMDYRTSSAVAATADDDYIVCLAPSLVYQSPFFPIKFSNGLEQRLAFALAWQQTLQLCHPSILAFIACRHCTTSQRRKRQCLVRVGGRGDWMQPLLSERNSAGMAVQAR